MNTAETVIAMRLHRIPSAWRSGSHSGEFVSVTGPAGTETAVVSVCAAESDNPDYLLDRYRAKAVGPLGAPVVQSLPDLVAEGVSIMSFDEAPDGSLHIRIDLVRRAWNLDIAVSAHGVALENAAALFSDMLDLLWELRPEGTP